MFFLGKPTTPYWLKSPNLMGMKNLCLKHKALVTTTNLTKMSYIKWLTEFWASLKTFKLFKIRSICLIRKVLTSASYLQIPTAHISKLLEYFQLTSSPRNLCCFISCHNKCVKKARADLFLAHAQLLAFDVASY